MSMSEQLETESVEFKSHGTRCAAWLTMPAGEGPHPGVVLVHGLGGTHQMMLAQYEQRFAAAGIAVLAFDYRNIGASDGEPRQLIAMHRQSEDVVCALEFLRGQPGIDAKRVGLWGTSLGSMHAVRVAADDPTVAVVVVQCPILHGPAARRASGIRGLMQMTPAISADVTRVLLRLPRRYIPIAGQPGTAAIVKTPDAMAGWNSMFPADHPQTPLHNRIAAINALGISRTSAMSKARQLSAPLLVCIADRETLTSQHYAQTVADEAPHGEAFHVDAGHFDVYHPPTVDVLLEKQTAFLTEHLLGVRRVHA
jgi:pimeloyl-ACP methyl ester carboxylesterase